MARENFLWGAPRIHGELLMLGYKVSQATVSRYLSTLHRPPGQSWRTFIRNQAFALSYRGVDYGAKDYQSLVDCSYRGQFTGPAERIVGHGDDNRGISHIRDIAVRGAHEVIG